MPSLAKQHPTQPTITSPVTGNGVLGTVLNMKAIKRPHQKICLYGRNRIGKSTLAAQWPKPMLLLACEPAENGGIESVTSIDGISPIVISYKPQIDPRTNSYETVYGTLKLATVCSELTAIYSQTGIFPFKTVVLDTVTALQDIVLAELLRLTDIPTSMAWGMASDDQYRERAEKTRELLRKVKDLPCDVIFVAQEKDHNPPKGDRVPAMIRPKQEGSFFGAALGGATAGWLHDTCSHVFQLYQDQEIQTIVTPVKIGNEVREETMQVPTGKIVRRLRTVYHPNYAGGCRSPNPDAVPEYIEAKTPKQLYEEIQRIAAGVRALGGKYDTPTPTK